MTITPAQLTEYLRDVEQTQAIFASTDIETGIVIKNGDTHIVKMFSLDLMDILVNGHEIVLLFNNIESELGNVDIIKATSPVLRSSKKLMNGMPDHDIQYPSVVTLEPTLGYKKTHPKSSAPSKNFNDLLNALCHFAPDDKLSITAISTFTISKDKGLTHTIKVFSHGLIEIISSGKNETTFLFEEATSDKGNIDIAKASEAVIKASHSLMDGKLDYLLQYPE